MTQKTNASVDEEGGNTADDIQSKENIDSVIPADYIHQCAVDNIAISYNQSNNSEGDGN